MNPNRWLFLRHPDGFDDHMFATFVAACDVWKSTITALLRNWRSLDPYKDHPVPEYEFGEPYRHDANTVALPLGGTRSYFAVKMLEGDNFPEVLYAHFPPWFVLDVDLGYLDAAWANGATMWRPAQPGDRAKLRQHPAFQKPPTPG